MFVLKVILLTNDLISTFIISNLVSSLYNYRKKYQTSDQQILSLNKYNRILIFSSFYLFIDKENMYNTFVYQMIQYCKPKNNFYQVSMQEFLPNFVRASSLPIFLTTNQTLSYGYNNNTGLDKGLMMITNTKISCQKPVYSQK